MHTEIIKLTLKHAKVQADFALVVVPKLLLRVCSWRHTCSTVRENGMSSYFKSAYFQRIQYCSYVTLKLLLYYKTSDSPWYRYPCEDCGVRFTTGKARKVHRCSRLQPPTNSKRRRTAGPSRDPEGTASTVNDLFKTIMILPTTSSCDVVGALHAETPRIADILRYKQVWA